MLSSFEKTIKEGAMNQLTAQKGEYTRNQGDLCCAFELGEGRFVLSEEA